MRTLADQRKDAPGRQHHHTRSRHGIMVRMIELFDDLQKLKVEDLRPGHVADVAALLREVNEKEGDPFPQETLMSLEGAYVTIEDVVLETDEVTVLYSTDGNFAVPSQYLVWVAGIDDELWTIP